MKLVYTLIIIVVGGIFAIQGSINSQLTSYLKHPLQGALANFAVGFVCLLVLNLIIYRSYTPDFNVLKTAPLHLYIGGLLGSIFVYTLILCIPKIGVSAALSGSIVGQLISASIIDHYGFFGVEKHLISPGRVIGFICLLLGVYLVQKY